MKNHLTFLFAILLLLCTSCDKDEDYHGEYMKTTEITVPSGNWGETPTTATNSITTDLTITDISEDVVNNGSVDLYFWTGVEESKGWKALPYSNIIYSASYTYFFHTIRVEYMFNDSSQIENPGMQHFKAVVFLPNY